ncbi:MAG: transporter substrate-binding domain-containing protein [Lachnospiraceae bacterium]|nr:transporter substrate-binding domain-containing protein [Lachnospiraceae bacterium]
MKKKILALFLASAMTMGVLVGCGSSGSSESGSAEAETGEETADETAQEAEETVDETAEAADDQLASILEAGEIIVALEGNWAPWSYHDEDDNLVGFDADVARAIAAELGVEVTFIEGDWDSLLAGLDAGRYDLVANGVEYTEERAEKYDFTDPYAYIRTALIVRSDNEDITSFEDLDGKTTANSIASTYMDLAESYGAEVTGVDSLDETLELVLSGRVDATLNAEVSYYDYMDVHPDAELKIVALTEEASNVVIPTRKGDDSASLREAINEAIATISENGTLSEISIQYFGSDITQE